MKIESSEVDYLIVGAGAMGMAFADEVLSALPDVTVMLVDRRAKPGGHWNDSYPYVTLHQPSAFYGLNSFQLGRGGGDLSSGSEIRAYYERALQSFEATGRLRFLPKHEYKGDGLAVSLLDKDVGHQITARKRIVDATYMNTEVPATHGPKYEVEDGVDLIPPNDLVKVENNPEKFVIVGGGKTAGDAVVFLRDSGVDPGRIKWIVPRDMWMLDRRRLQPETAHDSFMRMLDAVTENETTDAAFEQLEAMGDVMRLDQGVRPKKWRCATFDRREFAQMQSIDDVVRMGRVERVGRTEIQLQEGTIEIPERSLIVNCSAFGLPALPPVPLFEPGKVTLQAVVFCQQVFSASVIGRLETMDLTDAERNSMWQVVPNPVLVEDMPELLIASVRNVLNGAPRMALWLNRSRLNLFSHPPKLQTMATLIKARRNYPGARAEYERRRAAQLV